jgi:hypothetical protein
MRKHIVLICATFTIALLTAGCEFAIPSAVEISGNPAYHVPVGSPFVGEYKGMIAKYVDDYLSLDKLTDMINPINEETGKRTYPIRIYDYKPTEGTGEDKNKYNDVRTYLLYYPIIRMPYDLSEYVGKQYEITLPGYTVDLSRPKELEEFPTLANKTLKELLELTENDIKKAVDDKIDADNSIPPVAKEAAKEAARGPILNIFNSFRTNADAYIDYMNRPIEIPLGDMAKLVHYINVYHSGISFKGKDLEGKIRIGIPRFGAGTATGGTVTYPDPSYKDRDGKEDGDLYFVNTSDSIGTPTRFDPVEGDGKFAIYLEILDFFTGYIQPKLEFNWTDAEINPSEIIGNEGKLKGSYPIDLSALKDFMIDGLSFGDIKGYLYINDLPISKNEGGGVPQMILKMGDSYLTDGGKDGAALGNQPGFIDFSESSLPEKDGVIVTKTLPPSSIGGKSLDMALAFKIASEADGETLIDYTIIMGAIHLENKAEELKGVISADLAVKLALKFDVSPTKDGIPAPEGYVKLNLPILDDLLKELGDDDLLGREEATSDKIDIGGISVNLKDAELTLKLNSITPGPRLIPNFAIAVTANNISEILDLSEGKKEPSIRLTKKMVDYPFVPKFDILLHKEGGGGPEKGTFSVGRAKDFDFKIVVEASVSASATIEF